MRKKSRLKLKLYDENHLIDRGEIRFSWLRVGLLTLAFGIFFICAGMAIVWFTPIKNQLPGYMPVEQRSDTEIAVLKLDSLEAIYKINQDYIDNLATILDPDHEPRVTADTISPAVRIELDSLLLPSEIELEFIRKMEDAGYVIAAFDYPETTDESKEHD